MTELDEIKQLLTDIEDGRVVVTDLSIGAILEETTKDGDEYESWKSTGQSIWNIKMTRID